jgi:hypothetical protein
MWILHYHIRVAEFLSTSATIARPVLFIRKATSEDASGILACLSAAFEEYRDSYTAGAFADTVLAALTNQG